MWSNVLLIVVYNFPTDTVTKDMVRSLYANTFKEIFFYTDTTSDVPDVHQISIDRGCHVQKALDHFCRTYNDLIQDSDGVMYTMDDCYINTRLLSNFTTDKIISKYTTDSAQPYFKESFEAIDMTPGVYWYGGGDYFYLPRRYFGTNPFEKIATQYIFLHFAVPTMIHYLEPDENQYHVYEECFLKPLVDRDQLETRLEEFLATQLVIHPLKFRISPELENRIRNYNNA
jgi:hypothetical protein